MLFQCGMKVYKLRMEMNLWLTVSTNGVSTRLCHKWTDFYFFGTTSVLLDCDWRINFFKNGTGFPSLLSWLTFPGKQCVTSPPIELFVGFCSVNGILGTSEQVLYFLQFVETKTFLGWKVKTHFGMSIMDKIHLQKDLEMIFASLQNCASLDHTSKKVKMFVVHRD